MNELCIEHYGTTWRIITGWKDHGGEDGARWDAVLEWLDSDNNWHGSECWSEYHKRHVPHAMRRWLVRVTCESCPAHSINSAHSRCATCGIGNDDILSLG